MSDEFKITRYIENESPKANKNLVEVVRCGECKYWSEKACHKFLATHPSDADDFCSYGSRSEKPNNSTISKMEQVDKDINVPNKRQTERSK